MLLFVNRTEQNIPRQNTIDHNGNIKIWKGKTALGQFVAYIACAAWDAELIIPIPSAPVINADMIAKILRI